MNLRKWGKVITILTILLILVFALPVNASPSNDIIVVDPKADEVINKFKFRSIWDDNAEKLLKDYGVKGKDLNFLNGENPVLEPIMLSVDNLDNPEVLKVVADLVSNGNEVYIYGDSLDASAVKTKLGINEKKATDEKAVGDKAVEEKWNIIGFVNGDIYLQGVLNHKEKEKKTMTRRGLVTTADYGTDTTVKSSYNNKATYYSPDAWGNQILRAQLNVDWILKRNTSHDQDPDYDYFYVRDNAELTVYSDKGALAYDITANHTLPWPSSDNVLDWGPDSTSNVTTVTVGLPWSVSWSFTLGESLDIDTSGSQTYDKVDWRLHNWQLWADYPMPDVTRLQPGTAWASYGTYAGIDIINKAKFQYGGEYKYLTLNLPVRYDY